jgi:hypothetical protein
MEPLADGNWDDSTEDMDNLGFQQGKEAQIDGVVDMEDDVYLESDEEDDEEEEEVTDPSAPRTWKLLARYMANFKPNAHTMFTQFTEEGWHLRTGIRYSDRGKNYFTITLFSEGYYDFVMRGGSWIFKRNALLMKDFKKGTRPSEIILDSVPVWVHIYDVP